MYFMFSGLQSREFWLKGTQAIQEQCDIAFFIPGWEKSEGARAEMLRAETNKQPLFTTLQSLQNFREKLSQETRRV
jgi:hypothetical protein